jgi:hypothetical protein
MKGSFTIMDAGAAADLPEGVAGKRLPEWLFQPGDDRERGVRLRPDILLVSCPSLGTTRPGDEHPPTPSEEEPKTIHIIELGYSSDLSMDTKEDEKHQQHEHLETLLKRGNPRGTVTRHTIILGRTGAIPASLFTLLGDSVARLSKSIIQQVGRKLCRHAVQYIEKFTWARRTTTSQQHGHQGGEGGGQAAERTAAPPLGPSQHLPQRQPQQKPDQRRAQKRKDPP